MRRTCQLCGGKLVKNVCVECGLDNTKTDEMYTLNKSECIHEALTHVHGESEDPYAGKTVAKVSTAPKALKTGSTFIKIIAIIAVLLIVPLTIKMIQDELGELIPEEVYYQEEPAEIIYEDPYGNVTRELSETGEFYEAILCAGTYKGGVHIPEGTYYVSAEEGTGKITINDDENWIYTEYKFEDGEFVEGWNPGDVRIYRGAIITIEDTVTLRLQSENAQMDLTNMENPVSGVWEFAEGFIVGEEIPAGVYDVECLDGCGFMDYEIVMDDGTSFWETKWMEREAFEFPRRYNNVVLPEGTRVEITDMTILLTPSACIESEDYGAFYMSY